MNNFIRASNPQLTQPKKVTAAKKARLEIQKKSFGKKPVQKQDILPDPPEEPPIPKKVHPRDQNRSTPGPYSPKWSSKTL